ncbi:MAG: lysylphosphatidylglycerol synthase transmembrane domain-containing protein [Ardenticatenia bacterium]|nr:lysylphosphatidylglycerol synthase transmembrane domain-containing protein [Ardenticatenia bacterium]
MRAHVSNVIKLIISLALIAWLFRRIEVRDVVTMVRGAHPVLLGLATVAYVGAILSNALKWGVLLRAQNVHVPWRVVVEYTFVGVFFNNFLPANVGGDVMRGYGLAKYIRRRADAAVSVVVDRLIGLMALTSMAIVSALAAFVQHAANNQDLLAIAGVAVVSTTGLAGGFASC